MPAVAFVLLEQPEPPDPAVLVRTAAGFGLTLTHDAGSSDPSTFTVAGSGTLMVMTIAAPHPDAAGMPLGLASPDEDELARMRAHAIVAMVGGPEQPHIQDTLLAQLTTATVRASRAIAAMLGHGVCFHRAEFFTSVVEDDPATLPFLVCVDITRAPEPGDRMSFLTHGMRRYGREEFFVTASQHGQGALDFLLGMTKWMIADPEKQLPTGDTVGRSADERVLVQRVPDPTGEGPAVIRLDLDA